MPTGRLLQKIALVSISMVVASLTRSSAGADPNLIPETDAFSSSYPAYYLIMERSADGRIAPLHFSEVELSEPLESLGVEASLDADQWFSGRNCEPLEIQVRSDEGILRFRDLICIPRWVRAEFHGEDGLEINGQILPQDGQTFVVRIPALPDGNLYIGEPDKPLSNTIALEQLLQASPMIDLGLDQIETSISPPPADSANRVDLLVMGDGYTAAESALFDSQVAAAMGDFFAISPYAEYENYFNIHTLFTASTQSGADHPPYDAACSDYDLSCCNDLDMQSDPLAGTFVNTAFDSSYCYFGTHRLMYVNLSEVYAAAAAVPEWDVIFVLVNDSTYGGAGGSVMVASTHALSPEIAQHEFGHTFVDLADEYESPYPAYPTCSDITSPPCEANVTDVNTRSAVKWEPWIDPLTPVPTVPAMDPSFAGLVGLFEGARYFSSGMYRSGQTCIMRILGAPYCQVPSQAFVLKLYQGGWGVPWSGISMIEPGKSSPSSSAITLTHPAMQTFNVEVLEPIGGPPADIQWYVDGNPITGANIDTFQFSTDPDLPNPVEVRVQVSDATTLVHPAMAGSSLEFEQVWTVTVDYPVFLPLIVR